MTEQSPHRSDPTSLVLVGEITIDQFEHETHEIDDMYHELFKTNPNLALYLRRRASEVSPDLVNREIQSTLALEIVTLLAKQQGVAGLEEMFVLELIEIADEPKPTGPICPPAA